MWVTVEQWRKSQHSWLHDPFDEFDATQVEDISDNANKVMSQVLRALRDKELPGIVRIAETIKESVEEFRPQVPIVMALKTDGMKERHWEQMSAKIGFELKPYEGFTFAKAMKMNLVDHTEVLVDIGEKAAKEFAIENNLRAMKEAWETVELTLKAFKKTGTSTVVGFDEAMALLDDHIVLTQTM